MKRQNQDKIYKKIKNLFPLEYKNNKLPEFLMSFFNTLEKKSSHKFTRIPGKWGKEEYIEMINKYSKMPNRCINPLIKCNEIVSDLFSGVPKWRSPNLQYNVGAPTNTGAVAMYSLALEENIYNINSGLAGNALIAEQSVSKILAGLANVKTNAQGFFTFGGTATNFYAVKVGTKKAFSDSGKIGMSSNVRVMVTEDSHFSHTVSTDWLGIGTNNVIVIKANKDRKSDLKDAEEKMVKIFKEGNLLSTILINGGTTYSHTIDDIKAFVRLRDKIVERFSLKYKPHIHVDTVIGWAWLMFRDYDFIKNDLNIDKNTLRSIKKQYQKLSFLKYADSWGVDFHKGVGACPIPCSIIIFNNIVDLSFLSKKENAFFDLHQISPEFSFISPADFTLETSRQGGAALAALASLHILGVSGYQRNLANLVKAALFTRKLLSKYEDIIIYNKQSLGYVTMFGFYPPELLNKKSDFISLIKNNKKFRDLINNINEYTKNFFTWDYQNRMSKNLGVEYSFSHGYMKLFEDLEISALKLYPTSPHINNLYIKRAVKTIMRQKALFDKIWKKK